MEWVEGLGLFVVDVEWTERARTLIAAGKCRFVSPAVSVRQAGQCDLLGECCADPRAGA
ncbi:MAG: phage protease [Sodalis sp. (in: enterobacteria)]|uniref:phage protease n=1 Tax=Sodalis sp. (in: enterobacteria) TaxID=1898979 RepID=UPI003F333707